MKTLLFFLILIVLVIPLKATTIHVPGDYPTIQQGINASVGGDTVLVQPGTYNENILINRNIVLGSLFLTSGDTSYISSTIIDPRPVSSVVVSFTTGRDSTCVLTGFTLTGGRTDGFGGGISCAGASPTISYNIIRNNLVTTSVSTVCNGGGIYLEVGSNAKILNNKICDNTVTNSGYYAESGGGIYCTDSSPYISGNIISSNNADPPGRGGGIYFNNSQVSVFNNIIDGNSSQYGGGIYCDGNSNGIIQGNTIFADSAANGGGIYLNTNTNIEVVNNVIHSNYAAINAAGLHNGSSHTTINKNTFCFNESGSIPALYLLGTVDTVYNNIFYENIGSGAVATFSTYLKNCDFWGNSGGNFLIPPPVGTGVLSTVNINGDSCDVFGNIFMDPLLADTANFDFHLTQNSPCIDAGDPTFPLDPDNTFADIGALYFPHTINGTIIQPGSVSGIWTAANSPYVIHAEITIHADSTLTIEPGVEVLFQGHYKFIVNGIIHAVGTEQDSILFTAADSSVGWRGLRFTNSPDGSQLEYCVFKYGRATPGNHYLDRRGGAIFSNSSRPQISHCTISNCFADYAGGGIYISGTTVEIFPLITNCTIKHNSSGIDGGGIYSSLGPLEISNCIIDRNWTGSEGGGIYLAGGTSDTISILNCTVTNDSSSNYGGGIYADVGYINISGCIITGNNTGHSGGGLILTNTVSMVSITNSIFNTNRSNLYGGALYSEDCDGIINNCTVTENQASAGGGIAIINGQIGFQKCLFSSNNANNDGGALFFYEWIISDIERCTFNNNSATSGGAIYILYTPNTVEISSSIFSHNSPDAIRREGIGTIDYSNFYGNQQNISTNIPIGYGQLSQFNANGDSCDIYSNIFVDPIFADTSIDDFNLTKYSPCIDAGNPISPPDPDSTITDMGAYYFHQLLPIIYVNQDSLEFGEVEIGAQEDTTFTIFNYGSDTLLINQIHSGSAAFTSNFNPGNNFILPNDSMLIIVTFTPTISGFIIDTLAIDNNDQFVDIYLSGFGKTTGGIMDDLSNIPKKMLCMQLIQILLIRLPP